MWFWECPKRGCPFSAVDETEEAVRDAAVQHISETPDHEEWARVRFNLGGAGQQTPNHMIGAEQ
ncbi:hypothetical protein ACF1AJ_20695 [Leifsonia sp. NPDC014704]|uniref:hypothetical protein n=1 Tax=Leifsonia sp. NPDC014704 TaxID=3364123 RepID=UPI0036F49387